MVVQTFNVHKYLYTYIFKVCPIWWTSARANYTVETVFYRKSSSSYPDAFAQDNKHLIIAIFFVSTSFALVDARGIRLQSLVVAVVNNMYTGHWSSRWTLVSLRTCWLIHVIYEDHYTYDAEVELIINNFVCNLLDTLRKAYGTRPITIQCHKGQSYNSYRTSTLSFNILFFFF